MGALKGDLFAREVPNRFPKLEKLFEQAKDDFWNDSKAVDWSRELTLSGEERRALARVCSTLYYGERAALLVSAQLIPLVPDEEARFVLSAQVMEEAKHVSVFRRLLQKLDEIHPCDPWARRLLTDLARIRHPVGKLLGMQLIVENVANNLFHVLAKSVDDELVREVLHYVAYNRDELVARLRKSCEVALRANRITLEQSRQLLKSYEEGLSGYTYLERE